MIIPEPQFAYQTISVQVKILSLYDRDLHLDVIQQKTLTPQLDIRLNGTNIDKFLKSGYNSDIYEYLNKKVTVTNIRFIENTIYYILRY